MTTACLIWQQLVQLCSSKGVTHGCLGIGSAIKGELLITLAWHISITNSPGPRGTHVLHTALNVREYRTDVFGNRLIGNKT